MIGMDAVEIRMRISKNLDRIIQSTVDEGIFNNKSDLLKMALVRYLDDMHLLDQLKTKIETQPLD